MPAPAITVPALNDYAITSEEVTIPSCNVSNTPTYVVMLVNGYPFKLSKYATVSPTVDTYRSEVYGNRVGLCTAQTVYFMASNAAGGAIIATAPSTLTVTVPIRTTYNIARVIDRLTYLCQHPEEYGGNNTLKQYNVTKDFDDTQIELMKASKAIIWIHSLTETDESGGIGNLYNLVVKVQFSVFYPLNGTTSTQVFYDADSEIRYLIQENPDLQISSNSFEVINSKVTQCKFPAWNNYYVFGQMDIDCEIKINQRS
jgi:hypothetical protein